MKRDDREAERQMTHTVELSKEDELFLKQNKKIALLNAAAILEMANLVSDVVVRLRALADEYGDVFGPEVEP